MNKETSDAQENAPRPTLLLADDMPANLNILRRLLGAAQYRIVGTIDSDKVLDLAIDSQPQLILLDVLMPGLDGYEVCRRLKAHKATRQIPVIFITAQDETQGLVQAFAAGGVDYIKKPFDEQEVLVRVKTHLEIGRLNAELRQKNAELSASNQKLKDEIDRRHSAEEAQHNAEQAKQRADTRLAEISRQEAQRLAGFVGHSPSLRQILDEVGQLKDAANVNVLVTGESGTGKELVARALHFGGSRSTGPFVSLNCGAIAPELAESTLFGHVKGAFTGASAERQGCFEQADGGTLFLDEIGDMPLELQVKLLRVLEEGRLVPVGGSAERAVDVRVVAATNVDLAEAIAQNRFRQDLYFRLALCRLEVPPLRQRGEDVAVLARHFVQAAADDMGVEAPPLQPEALAALRAYRFPGNVRELKNMMIQALVLSGGGAIGEEHLRFHRAVEATGEAELIEEKIVAYIKRRDSIGNTECRELLDVEQRRAHYLLDRLAAAGRLQRQGTGRWTRYRLPD